jgi:uncharacterized protein YjiS (DUF1127 family)
VLCEKCMTMCEINAGSVGDRLVSPEQELCAAQIVFGEFEMTTITMSRETVRNHGLSATPGLMGQIKTYIARNHAERQLRQLDDRLLADIGLKRTDIGKTVWGR